MVYRRCVSFFKSLASVKSAQGASFIMTASGLVSKPLGYMRVLIIAWAFGTSAGMDAFYLASGIAMFFSGSVATALEGALLPELNTLKATENQEAAASLMSLASRAFLGVLASYILVIALFPQQIIVFFASGFDEQRVILGGKMLLWLIPLVIVTSVRVLLDTWSTFLQRYTLASLCSMAFNLVAIPSLLLLMASLGEFSVALSMGAGHGAVVLLMLYLLRGFPVKKGIVPKASISKVTRNTVYSVGMVGSQGLYIIVDRYFASLLPTGSVASISYASFIFGLLVSVVSPPLFIFLAKACEIVAEDNKRAEEYLRKAMALAWAYFLPLGFFLAVLARPVIVVLFSRGAFGSDSVEPTAIALAAYSVGLVFAVCNGVLFRFAQARQRLGRILIVTYVLVAVNAFLNWVFSKYWGIAGLAAATSCVQVLSVLYLALMVSLEPFKLLNTRLTLLQFFSTLSVSSLLYFMVVRSYDMSSWAVLAMGLVLVVFYFLCVDKLGFLADVPVNWRPIAIVNSLATRKKV